MVRRLAPPARSGAAAAPHAGDRAGRCWRWAAALLLAARAGPAARAARGRAGGVDARRAPLIWIGYARSAAASRSVSAASLVLLGVLFADLHGVHGDVDLRRLPGHRRADHRAVGDVGLRDRPEDARSAPPRPTWSSSTATISPFTDWKEVRGEARAESPDVVGSMPYVEAEVIVKHAHQRRPGMGIILRGIDPARAPHVLGLERTLQEGKVATSSSSDPGGRDRATAPAQSGDEPAAAPATAEAPEGADGRSGASLPGILLGEELYAAHPARLRRQRRRRRLPDVRRRADRADARS